MGKTDDLTATAEKMKAALAVIEIKARAAAEHSRRNQDRKAEDVFDRRAYLAEGAFWFLSRLFPDKIDDAPQPEGDGAPSRAEGLQSPPGFRGKGTARETADTENG